VTPLRVVGARKRFGEVEALAGVSLELRHGELLALLGPNGAGKTTLVRAIVGRVRLDAGQVELAASRVDGRPALGLVPQEVALYPFLSARENLEVIGRFHGLRGSVAHEAVAWALAWSGLEARSAEPVRGFSGGMMRRLNIAAGVLHRPPVVLLDEPTVGVDPQSRERIYEMLAELRRDGSSLLLATHQLEEAEGRCDRVVVLDHGVVVASGTVAELVEQSFGGRRTVRLTLAHEPAAAPDGCRLEPGSRVVHALVEDVVTDLPALVARVASSCEVTDVEVHRPGLGQVFLQLTGKELRE